MSSFSTMSTPTEPFSNLSLRDPQLIIHSPLSQHSRTPSPMAPPETVRGRALIMQDILSSFHEKELPSETRPAILNNVVANMGGSVENRPSRGEWTIQNDIIGTILQRAAYSTTEWRTYSKLQSVDSCSVIFYQKIDSRFNELFRRCDEINTQFPTMEQRSNFVSGTVSMFQSLSEQLTNRREQREYENTTPTIDVDAVTIILKTLERICDKYAQFSSAASISSPRQTRNRRASSEVSMSLFAQLISEIEDPEDHFLLPALEHFSVAALKANTSKLKAIRALLHKKNDITELYLDRFETLWAKANSTIPQTVELSGASGHQSGLEADPRPGSKRTPGRLEEAPQTPKRGRRASGK